MFSLPPFDFCLPISNKGGFFRREARCREKEENLEDRPQGSLALPKLQGYRCFGCGTANPMGLNMDFYCYREAVFSDLELGRNHVGWESLAHGGVVSAVLDEIMGWAVIVFRRKFFVTRSMEVRYLRPVSVEAPLRAKGEIQEEGSRGCKVAGALLDEGGDLLASATGEMVYLSPKRLDRLPRGMRDEMTELFSRMEALLGPAG